MGLDSFATSRATRDEANAAADVSDAKQAVSDNATNSANQLRAITAASGRRTTGGGQFGVVGGGRRGTINLGGAFGGLATANRKAVLGKTKAFNQTTMDATRRAAAQNEYGLTADDADKALSPGGLIKPNGFGGNNATKIDDAGNLTSVPV